MFKPRPMMQFGEHYVPEPRNTQTELKTARVA
jgi:hypothetical protein